MSTKKLQIIGSLKTEVDAELSTTSENPVQNKVVTEAVAQKSQVQIITWEADD